MTRLKVRTIEPAEFRDLIYRSPATFLESIQAPEIFVVRRFFAPDEILALRQRAFRLGLETEPSWHPLKDGCPDYHRVHDNYEKAYVKAKMHAFYFHYQARNVELFDRFRELFAMKNVLGGFEPGRFITDIPSDGQVARVNLQHYPRGGGYIAEHVDPVSPYAQIQTLVQGSRFGSDFMQGGVFARETVEAEPVFLDPLSAPGDLLVLSPSIPHGVAPIDPGEPYDWRDGSGRWIVNAIIVASDYPNPATVRPKALL